MNGLSAGMPYSPLAELVQTKVRRLILIGEDADTIAKELGEYATHESASDMHDAVARAFQSAEAGDIILLAPACASFDMFESFEHRGKVFKDEVSSLEFRVPSSRSSGESQ